MSAFIISKETMDRALNGLRNAHNYLGHTNMLETDEFGLMNKIGRDLFKLNEDAVEQRYPNDDWLSRPDGINDSDVYEFDINHCSVIASYKALQCLVYQCCEGDIPESPMFKRLEEASACLGKEIIQKLPEYNSAPWG